MFAVIGLGNPGKKYEKTRHNLGFKVIDKLADIYNIEADTEKYESLIGIGNIAGEEVILVKPLTFMNLSGRAVNKIRNKFKIPNSNIIVISDSLDLSAGKIRIRFEGSSGGHNGLESVIQYIDKDFVKVRLGIGRPDVKGDEISYVLSNIDKKEMPVIKDAVEKAALAVGYLISNGLESTMNKFN